MDLAVLADHIVKLKIKCKKDKYLELAGELKKLRNMQLTIIPNIITTLGTVTEGLLKVLEDLEIRGQAEPIKTSALLGSARILRRVLETGGY